MFYLITVGVLLGVFLIFPKAEKKQNLLIWIPTAIVAYQCLSVFFTGFMSIIRVNANIYTVSVFNLLVIVFLGAYIWRKKKIQRYYVQTEDVVFILIYIIIIFVTWIHRYTPELLIRFETSDPGTHLKMAMNFVNNQAVDAMYLGQVTNGLFIESLSGFFSGENVYKSFIIKYGINFCLSGMIFFAASISYASKRIEKIIVYAITLIYVFGYPFNDMIFGFVYLQLTITVIGYLLIIMNLYMNEDDKNDKVYIILLSLGCLGVGVGYTLFAPVTFIAILLCVSWKAKKEKWLIGEKIKFLNIKFLKIGMEIFLMPTIFTLWFIVVSPMLNSNIINYGSALAIEGYIYRNLYSDFLLFIVFAIYGIVSSIKEKKMNLCFILLQICIVFYIYFFVKMVNQEVSTYYFYKINYLLWLLILNCFVIGLLSMLQKEKSFVVCYLIGMIMLSLIKFSGFEGRLQAKNINYIPFADANAFFEVFSFNKEIDSRKTEVKQELVEICNEINTNYNTQELVVFIGYWLDLYWYEALTNQRFEEGYTLDSVKNKVDKFYNNQYGKFIVVIKESQEYLENEHLFTSLKKVYESDYAFIGKLE